MGLGTHGVVKLWTLVFLDPCDWLVDMRTIIGVRIHALGVLVGLYLPTENRGPRTSDLMHLLLHESSGDIDVSVLTDTDPVAFLEIGRFWWLWRIRWR